MITRILSIVIICGAFVATAEEPDKNPQPSITEHTIRIGNQTIPYRAVAGAFTLRDANGDPEASLFYVAYIRTGVRDSSERPVSFVFNGGPGSSSAWMHMAAFGPKRLVTPDGGIVPPAPYTLADNPDCLLGHTDLVFLDPVGTGFSHALGKGQDRDYWSVERDRRSMARAVTAFVTQNDRWNSPKFLIGESYGTFRAATMVNELQRDQRMAFNGLILLSAVFNLGKISFRPGEDLPYVLYLPSYAAAAWYHHAAKDRPPDVNALMADARRFATTEYAVGLMKGAALDPAAKADLATKVARITGLDEDYVMRANLRVTPRQFTKELQRRTGHITGWLDARFTGPSRQPLGEVSEYDPSLSGVDGAFAATLNYYVRQELNYRPDRDYIILNLTANQDWQYGSDRLGASFPGSPNVEAEMADAMVANPSLRIQIEIGIYDVVTPFLQVEHTVDHLELPVSLRKNIQLCYYESGHMMYLHPQDLTKLTANVGEFIDHGLRAAPRAGN